MESVSLVNHALLHNPLEFSLVGHDVITWRNHDVGFGIFGLDAPADISDAGGCIAAAWLTEDIPLWHIG